MMAKGITEIREELAHFALLRREASKNGIALDERADHAGLLGQLAPSFYHLETTRGIGLLADADKLTFDFEIARERLAKRRGCFYDHISFSSV
jgi:hypothetical protein